MVARDKQSQILNPKHHGDRILILGTKYREHGIVLCKLSEYLDL